MDTRFNHKHITPYILIYSYLYPILNMSSVISTHLKDQAVFDKIWKILEDNLHNEDYMIQENIDKNLREELTKESVEDVSEWESFLVHEGYTKSGIVRLISVNKDFIIQHVLGKESIINQRYEPDIRYISIKYILITDVDLYAHNILNIAKYIFINDMKAHELDIIKMIATIQKKKELEEGDVIYIPCYNCYFIAEFEYIIEFFLYYHNGKLIPFMDKELSENDTRVINRELPFPEVPNDIFVSAYGTEDITCFGRFIPMSQIKEWKGSDVVTYEGSTFLLDLGEYDDKKEGLYVTFTDDHEEENIDYVMVRME